MAAVSGLISAPNIWRASPSLVRIISPDPLFFLMIRPPLRSTLFPYTTLFRSRRRRGRRAGSVGARSWPQGVAGHDDAVLVAVEVRARLAAHAAEGDGDVDLAGPLLGALARVGPEGLDADVQLAEGDRVAHGPVDHQPGPAVALGQPGDDVADQGRVQRPAAVDHQHLALARFREDLADEDVVLVAADRADPAGEA